MAFFHTANVCFLFQLSLWINEKMLTAQDMSYDEARNLHSKWLKHQAFMAELASNKEWLEKIEKVSKKCARNALPCERWLCRGGISSSAELRPESSLQLRQKEISLL